MDIFWKYTFLKNFTRPSGKLRTNFTSPIAKFTSPGLSDTAFFARCLLIKNNSNDNDNNNKIIKSVLDW